MRRTLLGAVVAAVLLGFIAVQGVNATHQPAGKVAASGSKAIVSPPDSTVVLLQEKVKTSAPTDLILGVTAECVITNELTTVGNDFASAEGKVRVWIEVDGVAVPVSADDTGADSGKVTFCNEYEERRTTAFEDEDATIETLRRSGAANGFNWLRLNMGSGIHTITVKGEFTTSGEGTASALAAVGKRTLIIEPVKAANDEAVTELNP